MDARPFDTKHYILHSKTEMRQFVASGTDELIYSNSISTNFICLNRIVKIAGDAYLGVCVLSNSAFSRWWLSLLPLAVASTFGSVAFALGLCSLRNVKDQMQIDSGTKSKLETFVLRMTTFSLFVLIPQLSQIVLKFYEAEKQPMWEKNFYGENCDDLFVPCLAEDDMVDEKPSTVFILMKYCILLLPALAPMVWIANSKFINL